MSATLISPVSDEVKSSSIAFSSVFEEEVSIFFMEESTVTGSFTLPLPVSVSGFSTRATELSPSPISFSVPSDSKTFESAESKVSAVNVQVPASRTTEKTMLPLSSVDTSASFVELPFAAVTLCVYDEISGAGRAVRPFCVCVFEMAAGTAPVPNREILPFTMHG